MWFDAADGGPGLTGRVWIRLATNDDLPEVIACVREAYEGHVSAVGREPAPMVADYGRRIVTHQVHVAEDEGGTLVGMICFHPAGEGADAMHLEAVAVRQPFAGRGYGSFLIRFCEAMAAHRGFRAVELYTNAAMTANLAMYPALGYVETDRREENGFRRVYFRKELVSPGTPVA